jgi:hypothetical protein
MKGVPIPISFAVMLAAIVAVVIFFGAWAVSLDAEGRERQLSFIAAGGSGLDVGTFSGSQTTKQRDTRDQDTGGSQADAWWGRTLLKACPLH